MATIVKGKVVKGKIGDEIIMIQNNDLYRVECRYLGGYYTVFSSFDYDKALDFYNNHIQHLL